MWPLTYGIVTVLGLSTHSPELFTVPDNLLVLLYVEILLHRGIRATRPGNQQGIWDLHRPHAGSKRDQVD